MIKDQALRLALEALKANDLLVKGTETIGGLEWAMDGYYSDCFDIEPVTKQTKEAIKAVEDALEAKDEPLTENGMYRLGYHNGYGFGEAYGKANAPQRKPLTDEQIEELWDSTSSYYNVCDFARAIEAAHGIK